jgi:prepilin-type N-terminal cleavage/methylation domain-containing protein
MTRDKQRGFTLTELLTVIVIIGILASVVLVSLDLARKRARDSTMQRQLSQLRNVAEASFDWQDGYKRLEDMVGDSGSELEKIRNYIEDVGPEDYSGTELFNIKFSTDDKQYCAYARFISEPDEIFCIDSSGKADREVDSYFECYAGSGDDEISCDAYAECTVDGDCGMGETCVDGSCVSS